MVYFYTPIMLLRSYKISFVFSLLLIGVCQAVTIAQASFTATISPGIIGKNETAELRLMINNARRVDHITPPSLKDFIVVGGPNQESGMENNNGITRQYIGITYILQPKAKGRFIIEPALAKADGKTLRSNRVTLEVTNSTSSGNSNNIVPPGGYYEPVVQSAYKDYILKKGENVYDKINKNIFIKVDVNKNNVYEGEPIVVVYKLFTRLKSESSIIKNPAFNGFSVIDLMPPGNTYYAIEKLNGREYNVYTLRKSQLYPLQTGKIELESAEVENNIHFIKEEFLSRQRNTLDDMFRNFTQTAIPAEGMYDEKVTLRSKPVFINVKALPAQEKPGIFNGAVGKFNLESSLEKTNFTTDDAGKLRVIISGEGNMTMINAPDINWPAGIESFDPSAREQLNKYAVPVSGTKVFEYPFTVTRPGSYIVPAVSFCYFDAKQQAYKTITTQPFNIKVEAGSGKPPVFAKSNNTKNGKGEFFEMLFTNRWLIIVPLGILLITGLFVWLKKENKKNTNPARSTIAPASTTAVQAVAAINFKPLSLTEEKLIQQDHKGFYETINKEFRKFLADKLELPVETINKKKIAEAADKKSIPVSTCLQIQHLLDDIEWQLYTPFSDQDKMQETYNTADAVVHTMNAIVH